jgi:ParB family chromosome partitioning protein
MAVRKKAGVARAGTGKSARRKSLAPGKERRGLDAADIALPIDDERIAALAAQVRERGGAPIGAYREPLSGSTVLMAALPLASVQPTPFQRDLSPTHTKRLAQKIDEAGSFLDPIIVVRG